jgi:hypothetical protein
MLKMHAEPSNFEGLKSERLKSEVVRREALRSEASGGNRRSFVAPVTAAR